MYKASNDTLKIHISYYTGNVFMKKKPTKNKVLGDSKKKKPTKRPKKNTDLKKDIKYPIYCIGQKYFQQAEEGKLYPTTLPIMKTLYGSSITEHITHLLGYINEPSHTDYKQVYNDLYNTYKQMAHQPKEGDWSTIKVLLKHIFQDQYIMGLEYFWNLYLHPKQNLPFLGIVSEKKGTGKSTFLEFLHLVFKGNEAIVSGHDFKTNFNSSYASALICTSDEHCEAGDRTKIAQTMKSLITESKIRVEPKGVDSYIINWHGKFIFASNNEDKLTFVEGENTRYWIIAIPVLKTTVLDVREKLKKEIPAFLHYLSNVFEAREKRGRLYFSPEEFQTEASKNVQRNSRSKMYIQIEEALIDWFDKANESVTMLSATPKDLSILMSVKKSETAYIRRVLKKEFKLEASKNQRYKDFWGHDCVGSPFVFDRWNFKET
jgi:hypothetical protein